MMTHEQLAGIFEYWKVRYDEKPDDFADCEAFKAAPPTSYGDAAATYFEFLLDELTGDEIK